jgi:hypothetical protein
VNTGRRSHRFLLFQVSSFGLGDNPLAPFIKLIITHISGSACEKRKAKVKREKGRKWEREKVRRGTTAPLTFSPAHLLPFPFRFSELTFSLSHSDSRNSLSHFPIPILGTGSAHFPRSSQGFAELWVKISLLRGIEFSHSIKQTS